MVLYLVLLGTGNALFRTARLLFVTVFLRNEP